MATTLARFRYYSRRGLPRAGWFALLWWIVTKGEPGSWVVGLPAVVTATWLSVTLLPEQAWRWRILGAVRLLGYFLWQSIIGGLDVAWRALHPRLPMSPGLYTYPLRLAPGPAQTLLANIVSLLPGTLSAALQENQLTLHVVDTSQPILAQTQRLEAMVASLFDMSLSSEASHRT
ncbi:MAG: hypothetical protein ETSY1_20595 [Candidatus Entotheonella factor]|uniref:Cation transporter n=1 Tax=Entotheonella factor TaxID=1429438 RepID=W4LIQ4_ENTF1|nr:Na+/H+ antiporter subunit E [Candidatus Entotheonella palauensis]ETW97993.1 MAG: hypothetical protein ETSY1_20595 [Candidatus Entotheonella factor]